MESTLSLAPSLSAVLDMSANLAFTQPVAVLTTNSPIEIGEQISLDGSNSRADSLRTIVGYEWTLVNGAGNQAFPPGSSATTTASRFQVPAPRGDPFSLGQHRFRLIVTDDRGSTSPADFEAVVVVATPTFLTTMGPGARLPVRQHQFRLQVVDDSGNESQPVVTTFTVLDPNAPPDLPAISYRKALQDLVVT